MPLLEHLVVEGLVVGVAKLQMAYVEVAQVVGIGVVRPKVFFLPENFAVSIKTLSFRLARRYFRSLT